MYLVDSKVCPRVETMEHESVWPVSGRTRWTLLRIVLDFWLSDKLSEWETGWRKWSGMELTGVRLVGQLHGGEESNGGGCCSVSRPPPTKCTDKWDTATGSSPMLHIKSLNSSEIVPFLSRKTKIMMCRELTRWWWWRGVTGCWWGMMRVELEDGGGKYLSSPPQMLGKTMMMDMIIMISMMMIIMSVIILIIMIIIKMMAGMQCLWLRGDLCAITYHVQPHFVFLRPTVWPTLHQTQLPGSIHTMHRTY